MLGHVHTLLVVIYVYARSFACEYLEDENPCLAGSAVNTRLAPYLSICLTVEPKYILTSGATRGQSYS